MLPSIPLREPTWVQEFKAFVTRGNVIDLAVGVVIGAAFTTIVSSLVEDLINPLIGLMVGGIDFSNVFVVLSGERAASLEATRNGGAAVLALGKFINAVIKFAIVALAIFWMLKLLARFRLTGEKKAAPTASEVLLTEIRDELRAARRAEPAVPGTPAA
ncbi:large-conductance mechanosensitive channel protein MscL [Roseomonas sp. BN140053]|uniref:large-conductance mechanosensitive channel protein MscL n=1 Tax=Roseomonas sp. BN140053 TaxID=3391898 RepID=UPI0039EC6576